MPHGGSGALRSEWNGYKSRNRYGVSIASEASGMEGKELVEGEQAAPAT